MAYADFTFYTDTYKGNAISSSDFDRLATRASSYIDNITNGTAAAYTTDDSVKMAACSVAEAWQKNESGGHLMSEKVGSWSRTYAESNKSDNQRLYEAAKMYLSRTGLLSRWI